MAAVNVVDAERDVRNAFYECLWPASNYLGAYAVVVVKNCLLAFSFSAA